MVVLYLSSTVGCFFWGKSLFVNCTCPSCRAIAPVPSASRVTALFTKLNIFLTVTLIILMFVLFIFLVIYCVFGKMNVYGVVGGLGLGGN